jgi:hypothetical protein
MLSAVKGQRRNPYKAGRNLRGFNSGCRAEAGACRHNVVPVPDPAAERRADVRTGKLLLGYIPHNQVFVSTLSTGIGEIRVLRSAGLGITRASM